MDWNYNYFYKNNASNDSYFEEVPEEKWSNFIFFLFSLFFITVSGIFFSLCLELISNNEWSVAKYFYNSNFDFFTSTFPYYFLLIGFASLIFATITIKASKKEKNIYLLFFSLFIIVIAFAFILNFFSYSKKINTLLKNHIFYETLTKNRQEMWQRPDFGLLSGKVVVINNNDSFTLIDNNNKIWAIHFNNTKLIGNFELKHNQRIKIVGKKINKNVFEALEIKLYD